MFEPLPEALPTSTNPAGDSWQMRLPTHCVSARSEDATSSVLAKVVCSATAGLPRAPTLA